MCYKVAVQRDPVPRSAEFDPVRKGFKPPLSVHIPLRFRINGEVREIKDIGPLLQEQNVCRDFRSGVCFERRVRQTDRSDQVSALRDVATDRVILLVHRIRAGNERHDTAGTDQIERLRKEVIVDRKMIPVIGRIRQRIAAEGHITDRCVKRVVEVVLLLEAVDPDFRAGVKLLCDPAANAVKLNAAEFKAVHALRQTAEEVADTHCRFKHPVAVFQSEALYRAPHFADNDRRRVVCICCRSRRRTILVFREKFAQFFVLACPVFIVRRKSLRQAAPADVLRESVLLFGSGHAILCFNLFQRADSTHVPLILCFRAAYTQIIVGDTEIPFIGNSSRNFINDFRDDRLCRLRSCRSVT